MNGKELVQTIEENKNKIEVINTQKENLEKYRSSEIHTLKYKVYGPQIDVLEKRLRDETENLEKLKEKEIAEKQAEIRALYQPLNQAKRIIQFLHVKDTNEKRHPGTYPVSAIDFNNVVVRHGNYKEDLGFLINEEMLTLRLMIISNDKPVNSFSLIVMGNTAFYDSFDNPLLNVRFNKPEQWQHAAYYSDYTKSHAGVSARIDTTIKTAKDPEELKEYAKKHKILAEFIAEYETVKTEYEMVLKNYSLEDFKEFQTEE